MDPIDSFLWQLLAYCGTGGSIFIIGSAASEALMGLERSLNFVIYLEPLRPVINLAHHTNLPRNKLIIA